MRSSASKMAHGAILMLCIHFHFHMFVLLKMLVLIILTLVFLTNTSNTHNIIIMLVASIADNKQYLYYIWLSNYGFQTYYSFETLPMGCSI